ncbi:MAG: 2-hydroxyacid dehydrogenase [Phycisphaerales bacterium JB059]
MSQASKPVVGVTRKLLGEVEIPGAAIRVGGERDMPREELLEFVSGTSGLITWVSERVDGEVLDAAGPGLKVVANHAVGVDNIDLEVCRARGVMVCNTPDAVTEGTANMAIALMLAVARRVVEGDAFARSGRWAAHGTLGPSDFIGQDLTGRTLLVVGAGRIGFATAQRALAFGMRVLYVARSRHWAFEQAPMAGERVSLEEGLSRADVVSLHCPLTTETRHLIDAEALGRMKSRAILVNTARGPVVDEAALSEALREGRIFGAGLDVFEEEPRVHEGLVGLSNVVMTPHIGSAEERYRREMTAMVSATVAAALRGEAPPNRVV